MHQDTRDALELLAEALAENPDSDTFEAVDVFDALPSVERVRRMIARALVQQQARDLASSAESEGRSQRTSSRVGRRTPNADGHQIGDTVYFKGNTTKYLRGLPVEVVGTNGASVNVRVPDEPRYRRFAGKTGVRCPNAIITSVNPSS